MKIATFNVNSIKARLGNVLDWLKAADPDIALLQEIKCAETEFPGLELSGLGYRAALVGQKTYNGVAILAKQPIDVDLAMLSGDDADEAARYIEGRVGSLRVASIYVPNGQNVGSEKFQYKMGFLARLERRIKELLAGEEPFVLGGDYNIAPFDIDVHDPKAWRGQIMVSPEERGWFRRYLNLGLTDAYRVYHPETLGFSWWDYRAGAWQRDMGLRIDHLLLSPQAADRLTGADIDRDPRGKDKASDHTPVWCALQGGTA
jgi:exodeoxyribonuclease-3